MEPSLRISNSLTSCMPCSATILNIWRFIFPKFSKTSRILILVCCRIQWLLWRWWQFSLMNSSYFLTQLSSLVSISWEGGFFFQNSKFFHLIFTFNLERRMSSLPFMSSCVASVEHKLHCQEGTAGIAEYYSVFIRQKTSWSEEKVQLEN